VKPTDSELVDAWVTLDLLKEQAIAGEVTTRRFDTFTACAQGQATIEIALERDDPDYLPRLWDAVDERKAELHA
jgi:hypothetical protein